VFGFCIAFENCHKTSIGSPRSHTKDEVMYHNTDNYSSMWKYTITFLKKTTQEEEEEEKTSNLGFMLPSLL
jgi:hypothetical protein